MESFLRKSYRPVRLCWQVLLYGAGVLWYHMWSFSEQGLCQHSFSLESGETAGPCQHHLKGLGKFWARPVASDLF